MEEMLEDTLEGLDEDPELEEEAEEEVDRVLFEITDGKLGVAGAGKELPVRICIYLNCARFSPSRRLSTTRKRKRSQTRKWHVCRLNSTAYSVDRFMCIHL